MTKAAHNPWQGPSETLSRRQQHHDRVLTEMHDLKGAHMRNPSQHKEREGDSKVWFVTGSSRGFGRSFVEAALSRGDKVAATARNAGDLDDLASSYGDAVFPLKLDVTEKAAVFETVRQAKDRFGRLDIIVNNAGYGLFGAVEELTDQQLRNEFETNVIGALSVVQAALPYLREQGAGHIIQMSSIAGVIAMPLGGGYHASRWALEALSESLAQEVAGFGIRVTLVEPSAFATRSGKNPDPFTDGVQAKAEPIYDSVRDGVRRRIAKPMTNQTDTGDPAAAAQALLRLVDSDSPPLRVFFGPQGHQLIQQIYADRLKTWAEWQDLSVEAYGSFNQVAGEPRPERLGA